MTMASFNFLRPKQVPNADFKEECVLHISVYFILRTTLNEVTNNHLTRNKIE